MCVHVCVCVCMCVCVCVCAHARGFSVQYLMTPFKVRGLSGISIGIIMGVTLCGSCSSPVGSKLDNSIWKAGGSTGYARLLPGLNCSVSEPMGVPLTPPWVVDLQCVAIVGLGPLAPIFVGAGCWLNLQ